MIDSICEQCHVEGYFIGPGHRMLCRNTSLEYIEVLAKRGASYVVEFHNHLPPPWCPWKLEHILEQQGIDKGERKAWQVLNAK